MFPFCGSFVQSTESVVLVLLLFAENAHTVTVWCYAMPLWYAVLCYAFLCRSMLGYAMHTAAQHSIAQHAIELHSRASWHSVHFIAQ